jgi:hypothetical protein
MTAPCKSVDVRYRIARTASLAAVIVVVCALVVSAQTTPSALFQNSTLTSTTNTINVTQLPVVTSSGISYFNLTIPFDVSITDGKITITPGTPQQTAAPRPLVSGFKAGNYQGPSTDSSFLITVSGPGVGSGGTTEWSLLTSSGANGYTYPSSANWYVGPLNSNNPMYPRLKAAGITSTAYSYGTSNGSDGAFQGEYWANKSLLGFAQTGSGLTIVSFTYDGHDYSTPQSQITYEFIQP